MRMRTVLIGVFALVFGASAASGVYLLSQTKPAAAPKPDTVSVVVAAEDINRGQTIAADLVTQKEWPKESLPEGAITDPVAIEDRTVTIPLVKGDLLLEAKLAPKGSGRGLAAVIPSGMRAVTIQTPNVATGVAGFILPGNKVDVLLTMSSPGMNDLSGGGSTITLLQNVEILAVDQQVDVPQDNKVDTKELRSVTLLVTPAEAARLDLGQNKGTLRLTLRNPADKATDVVDPVTLARLSLNPVAIAADDRNGAPTAVAKTDAASAPQPKRIAPMIRTLRGTRSGVIQLPIAREPSIAPNEEPSIEPPTPPKPDVPTDTTTDPVRPLASSRR